MNYKLMAFINWITSAKITGVHSKKVIVLDNIDISGAEFKECKLIYGGGGLTVSGAFFNNCTWHFYGKASSTLELMKCLESSGATDLISNSFPKTICADRIRNGRKKGPQ